MYRSQFARARGRVLSVVERGAYRPGVEPLVLDELVSPLRYDIVVRADYFDWLADRLDLYDADFEEFVRAAVQTPYFTWFTRVALVRYHPERATDPRLAMLEFRERLHRSTGLLRRFGVDGFDSRFPVSVRTAAAGATTATGKSVQRSFYPGDGCHRLALLLRSGASTLAPAYYRVHKRPKRKVIDNTHLLVRELRLAPEDYYRFLSRGYADRALLDEASLLGYVAQRRPDRLAELRAVIAADADAFVAPPEGRPASRVD